MTCAHAVVTLQATKYGERPVCSACKARIIECSFCDAREVTGEHVRAWRKYGVEREQRPTAFPVDFRDLKREILEWLCCPACFAESGEAAMLRYLNEPRSMVPAPWSTRVVARDGTVVSERYRS